MKTIIAVLSIMLFVQSASAQIKTTNLNKGAIPAAVKYVGKPVNVAKFIDSNGEHLVITTETGVTQNKTGDGDGRNAELYAYQYLVKGTTYTPEWQVHDFEKDCQLDIEAQFVPNTFAITDLDKNGIAEVWLMYRTTCRGDISPSDQKIIMYEGKKKFAARGTCKVKVSATAYDGGSYTFDAAFKAAPDVFRKYASALWQKNLMESF